MKKALLYNPYLDVMGGGERHILSIMELLAKGGYQVDIAWDKPDVLTELSNKLRMDTSIYTIVPNAFIKNNRKARNTLTAQYDILIYVTDGSYFTSKAKRNIIFSMSPDRTLFKLYPTNWFKLRGWEVIGNGDVTSEKVSQWLHRPVTTIYPYIEKDFFVDTVRKENVILGVGRFFQHLHSKRHDVLIKAFTMLQQDYKEFRDFTLVLAGGLKKEDETYYGELQTLAKINDNILFRPNIPFADLRQSYKTAMFYWHAAGYDVDEELHPEQVEHFGMSPLEAMASKCLTICHDSGGPKRYITQGSNGYLYTSIDELVTKTAQGYSELQRSEQIVENGKLFVGTHFSYPIFKSKVEQFFRL
jgi:glycosyltransferase involved in cell wall biosynthesis